jgi:hypothetical protein
MLVYCTPNIESLIKHHTMCNSCDDSLQESNCDTNYNDKINKIYVVTTKSKVMYERQVSRFAWKNTTDKQENKEGAQLSDECV